MQHQRFMAFSPDYGFYIHAATLLGLFLLFRISHVFSDLLIEKIPGFSPALRRLIAGRACIEGDWPLVVVTSTPSTGRMELTYLGFMNITYHHGQLKVTGRDWTPDGGFAHDFESQQSRLDGNCLQYWYKQGEGERMRGYTEIYFFPADQTPERLAGEFLDKEHNAARFYARRLPHKVKRLRSNADRLEAARQFWSSIEPDIDQIAKFPVEVDWD